MSISQPGTDANPNPNMIALYYCYPPSPITNPSNHATFHQDTCTTFNLGGRIRVSSEGINGVLSGRIDDLNQYELKLRQELIKEVSVIDNDTVDSNEEKAAAMKQTYNYLDIKYCHLREDIPVKEQLFGSLNVKVTREVVSLFDFNVSTQHEGKKGKRCRQRRRQKRKEKKLTEKLGDCTIDQQCNSVQIHDADTYKVDKHTDSSTSCVQHNKSSKVAPRCVEVGTAFTIHDWEQYTPAEHLSPSEWNDQLLSLSRKASTPRDDQQVDCGLMEEAVILDARNIYETRVGHFAVPNLPTFFPNTRKFSSLPMALNTLEAADALAGKKVFMYCTGGIRCERAGSYLRALSESNVGAWKDKPAPKGIYQLKGGIQRYLESYGEPCENNVCNTTSKASHETEQPCLYRGKNFVFDPRRTDPVVGNGIAKSSYQTGQNTNKKDRISLVGKCIVCFTPHDDYDNGHAPCEGKEARCYRCRVLVLICNKCRANVRCWGESEGEYELYCGNMGKTCVDEGNIASKVETEMF